MGMDGLERQRENKLLNLFGVLHNFSVVACEQHSASNFRNRFLAGFDIFLLQRRYVRVDVVLVDQPYIFLLPCEHFNRSAVQRIQRPLLNVVLKIYIVQKNIEGIEKKINCSCEKQQK